MIVPAWIQLALLCLAVVVNYVALFCYIYRKCCLKKSDNQVYPPEKLDKDDRDKQDLIKNQSEVSVRDDAKTKSKFGNTGSESSKVDVMEYD